MGAAKWSVVTVRTAAMTAKADAQTAWSAIWLSTHAWKPATSAGARSTAWVAKRSVVTVRTATMTAKVGAQTASSATWPEIHAWKHVILAGAKKTAENALRVSALMSNGKNAVINVLIALS